VPDEGSGGRLCRELAGSGRHHDRIHAGGSGRNLYIHCGYLYCSSFPQNYLTNVQAGNEVELILDPYPGRLFKAKVDTVITATGEGQFAPRGTIPDASKVGSQGLLAVKIGLTDKVSPANLPLGAGGTVAIYTDYGKPVHIISKVVIRMKKWLSYVVPS
jgi:hypothetical protein